MGIVLQSEQREQAGSDSYNRFEYQTHWIVYHIIDQIDSDSDCVVLCEYHDDMAQTNLVSPDYYEFYQIKTKEELDVWTIAELSKKAKRSDGTYKKSFLGFIFYNYMTFGSECGKCYFISNNDFDADVRNWQACIEDGKRLFEEDCDLYKKIKDRISQEYENDLVLDFDSIYEKFIQNTYIQKSELHLETFEEQISGQFFKKLSDKNIPARAAHLILQQIIEDVRKKSRQKTTAPTSFTSLISKKGIKVKDITNMLADKIPKKDNYSEFTSYLQSSGLQPKQIERIIESKSHHETRWLDVEDIKYQEIVLTLRENISEVFSNSENIDIKSLTDSCNKILAQRGLLSLTIDDILIEVLIYEQGFAAGKSTKLSGIN